MDDARVTVGSDAVSATGAAIGMGSAATAAAVSACCAGPALGPVIVALFGASGAVVLEGLRPYTLLLLILSGMAIGLSFLLSMRRPKRCSVQRSSSLLRNAARTFLWVSGMVWLGAVVLVVWARFA